MHLQISALKICSNAKKVFFLNSHCSLSLSSEYEANWRLLTTLHFIQNELKSKLYAENVLLIDCPASVQKIKFLYISLEKP